MAEGTWRQLTSGLEPDDVAKLRAFRDFCRGLPDVAERIHTSEIAYARRRVFASAYVKSHYLELGIELTRTVSSPKPRTTFATTKRVTMHRYSLRHLEDFDDAVKALVREAADTVGPGAQAIREASP